MNQPAVVGQKSEMRSGGAVMAIVPQNYDEAWRIANTICTAGMAPRGLETPEKAMVAIMHGLEVGFTPMAALQSIAVIQGRPTIWGDGALGLVQGSGKMEWIKEWFEGEGDLMVAHCHVKRFNDVEVKKASFSVADAKAAGLLGKQGPWTQYRSRMLKMRARSWALRDGFSDVLRGLGVTEEVQDFPQAPDQIPHTVVGSEPLPADDLKMPSVRPSAEQPPAVDAPPDPVDPGAGVVYVDWVVKVLGPFEDKAAGKPKFGIQTKTLGSKKLIGTYDEDLVAVAKQAAESGVAVELCYSHEDGKKPVLESIVVMPA